MQNSSSLTLNQLLERNQLAFIVVLWPDEADIDFLAESHPLQQLEQHAQIDRTKQQLQIGESGQLEQKAKVGLLVVPVANGEPLESRTLLSDQIQLIVSEWFVVRTRQDDHSD